MLIEGKTKKEKFEIAIILTSKRSYSGFDLRFHHQKLSIALQYPRLTYPA